MDGGETKRSTMTNPKARPTKKLNIFVLEWLAKGWNIQTFKLNFGVGDQW